MLSYLTMTPNQEFENNPLNSKENIFLSTYPLDKHYINLVFQNPRVLVQKVSSGS